MRVLGAGRVEQNRKGGGWAQGVIRDPSSCNTPVELWRGMANMEVDEQGKFVSDGGTEMAVMSTTSNKEVALDYSRSQSGLSPLVFNTRPVV